MKPRIFISSTFYDLKYIREDLANFVRSYGYEPVLFEDGDIGYTPGRNLDKSCYESMKNSDMVILIIGGEYGSPASGECKDEFKEYMSVTRKEFRTAVESGIPIFVMIDKKVMAEYGVYDANYDDIENENRNLTFPTTKNINVFRFVKEIKGIVTLPIQEFEQSSDIKGFISKQWADMFKNYLNILRSEKENKKIESSISEINTLIKKMEVMLNRVGQDVLSKDGSDKYEEVINEQEIISFCNQLVDSCEIYTFEGNDVSDKERKMIIKEVLESLKSANSDREFVDALFMNLSKYEVSKIRYSDDFEIRDKLNILDNESNQERVIDLMSTREYYDRMFP